MYAHIRFVQVNDPDEADFDGNPSPEFEVDGNMKDSGDWKIDFHGVPNEAERVKLRVLLGEIEQRLVNEMMAKG